MRLCVAMLPPVVRCLCLIRITGTFDLAIYNSFCMVPLTMLHQHGVSFQDLLVATFRREQWKLPLDKSPEVSSRRTCKGIMMEDSDLHARISDPITSTPLISQLRYL